jgi:hypothetical protein
MKSPANFKIAVQETPALKTAYRDGIQALDSRDHDRIVCKVTRNLTGSINLDATLKDSHPGVHRWDYGIGVRTGDSEVVVWVEVHPATLGDVDDVCKKHTWLRQWLQTSAPKLNLMPGRYVWVASGRVSIPANSPQRKKLALKGIAFEGRVLQL